LFNLTIRLLIIYYLLSDYHNNLINMSQEWFFLSRRKIKWLFSYYIVLNIISIPTIIFALIYNKHDYVLELSVVEVALIGGIGTAITGCSIFYLRKLYKACINKEMNVPISDDEKNRELGIFAYFFLRPIFAIVFSILIDIVLRSSVDVITVKDAQLDEGFVYLSMFLSFFAGFAAGDVITYVEAKSKELITSAFNRS